MIWHNKGCRHLVSGLGYDIKINAVPKDKTPHSLVWFITLLDVKKSTMKQNNLLKCRTTQLLWTDVFLTTEETGGREMEHLCGNEDVFSVFGYVLLTKEKLPYAFSVIFNALPINPTFFLNEHSLFKEMEELNAERS